jgi:hypothetical protein
MTKRRISKLVHVNEYVAEVDVELIYNDDDWSPYLSVEDASKLDDVRDALAEKDIARASQLSRVFKLLPIGS